MELIPASFMFLNGRISTSVLFKILDLSSAFKFTLFTADIWSSAEGVSGEVILIKPMEWKGYYHK